MANPPKTITMVERSRLVNFVSVLLYIAMLIVIINYLILPLYPNWEIMKYLQSQNLISLFIGIIVPSVVVMMLNGKLQPTHEIRLKGEGQSAPTEPPVAPTPKIRQAQLPKEPTEPCFSCYQDKPVSELKTIKVCKTCCKEQGVPFDG